MHLPTSQRSQPSAYITPLFRWLQSSLGRTWVQTLVFVMAFQGIPLGQLRWQGPGGAVFEKLVSLTGLSVPSAHSATRTLPAGGSPARPSCSPPFLPRPAGAAPPG